MCRSSDHFCPPNRLLELQKALLVLVALEQNSRHLHPSESLPLGHWHIILRIINSRSWSNIKLLWPHLSELQFLLSLNQIHRNCNQSINQKDKYKTQCQISEIAAIEINLTLDFLLWSYREIKCAFFVNSYPTSSSLFNNIWLFSCSNVSRSFLISSSSSKVLFLSLSLTTSREWTSSRKSSFSLK